MHRITNNDEAHNILLRLGGFIEWSKQNNVNQQSYMKCVEAYLQIINREKINLDAEFNHDQMERVLEFYTHNNPNVDSPHPDLGAVFVRIDTDANTIETEKTILESYRNYLNEYRRFCEEHPPE
ncbi:MAG: hypothetical protein K8953_04655 [Proteobacteria bacterium]|nr:hypothetical protein [Pseudomonadota bacterium]